MKSNGIGSTAPAVFGTETTLPLFIRQLFVSRDYELNTAAQKQAFREETKEMADRCEQISNTPRLVEPLETLGIERKRIEAIDETIEKTLGKKLTLIVRYGPMIVEESSAILSGQANLDRKDVFDLLSQELDEEMACYNAELERLRAERAQLWTAEQALLETLAAEEEARNERLDAIYCHYKNLLEKLYLHYNQQAFEPGFVSKVVFLPAVALASSEQLKKEQLFRQDVCAVEQDINYAEANRHEVLMTD